MLEGHENGVSQENIPVEDGLIIDVDDNGKKWLIDAVVTNSGADKFTDVYEHDKNILIEVVITSEKNYPATMVAKVQKMTDLTEKTSVLLEGHIAINRDEIIDLILHGIVDEGISGKDLLHEFKKRKGERGVAMQRLIDDIYNQVKSQGTF